MCINKWMRPFSLVAAVATGFLWTAPTHGGDYYDEVVFPSETMIGADSEGAVPVDEVPGKEYSHNNWMRVLGAGMDPDLGNLADHNASGGIDPLQTVSWDGKKIGPEGNSGSVDGFDYGVAGFNFPAGQVDAMAHGQDFLLRQVVRNEATLLFSTTADLDASSTFGPTGTPVPKAHVHWEDPVGGDGVWAEFETGSAGPGPGAGVNHHPVMDVDALEVWGPEPPSHNNGDTEVVEGYVGGFPGPNTADANRFSLDGDSLSGISIWEYDISSAGVSPYILHSTIVDAVEELFIGEDDLLFSGETRQRIDVDGTMVLDLANADGRVGSWSEGDELLFTIDPILEADILDVTGGLVGSTLIDGGEIMHLVNDGGGLFSISFLSHGGHLWDTDFEVASTFGYFFEDVDALEAVGTLTGDTTIAMPEPATASVFALFGVIATLKRRRA